MKLVILERNTALQIPAVQCALNADSRCDLPLHTEISASQTEASFEYFEQNPSSVEVDGNFTIHFSWASVYFSSNEICGKVGILEEHTG